ncbi:alpha/beta hydrolase [Lasiosphaeria hispida]|uniref:Alpha/beta hydrolase n=1 Tax=Lasiosphaeria hispida TaxID=260671 RepID=A0AAJ0HDE6_9PEZI|nr:alpha/beta hydrolase [Lasiosphaeria hispida]
MSEPLEARNFFPALQRNVTPTPSGSTVVSYTSDLGDGKPILTLIHGYPQSAFIWRHITPTLLGKVSLFIPELPGYGISTPSPPSKRSVGAALLAALSTLFSGPRHVILSGHDRGARICHRLAVDAASAPPNLKIIGAFLLDIVPTKVQWDRFSDPAIARGYFHWPLLANVELAVGMLKAYGGGRWARGAFRLAGKNEEGLRRLEDGVEVYVGLFDKEEVIRGSCEDYEAGAGVDVEEQVADQREGRKIGVPTVVMFSEAGLGARMDVAREWADWVQEGVPYEAVPVGEGYGHYLPEEAHDIVSEKMISFLKEIEGVELN